jgi:hypothetical protein
VLFEQRLRDGIHDGRIVLAYRRWQRSQVVAGRRYRTGLDLIQVESVDVITLADIDSEQVRSAGYGTIDELTADLRGTESMPLYRIRFLRVDEADARDELAATATLSDDELAALATRLARMDRTGTRKSWTAAVLAQIAGHPGTVSTKLAEATGWPRPEFKQHVRRLKELGLTYSLDVGYRLSPRGEAYLRYVNRDNADDDQLRG